MEEALSNLQAGLHWGLPQIVALLVACQRLLELQIAKRNTRYLLAQEGAIEVGAGHYFLFVILHTSWLLAIFLLIPGDAWVSSLLLFAVALLQLGRIWVIASLGIYWTTRVITIPSAPLIRKGPYRFLRHPNYLIVAMEIAILPLAFGAWQLAVLFTLLNLALICYRVGIENTALERRLSAV